MPPTSVAPSPRPLAVGAAVRPKGERPTAALPTVVAHRRLVALAVALLAVLAVLLPVSIAIRVARDDALSAERAHSLEYARDVLARVDATTDQTNQALMRLAASPTASSPCGAANLALMRRLDVTSTNIQAVGYVRGGRLVCSSESADGEAYPLGPIDFVGKAGVAVRMQVRFPFAPDNTFIVIERSGFAVIVSPELPLEIAARSDVDVASYSSVVGRTYAVRGAIDPAWARLGLKPGEVRSFRSHGRMVTVVASQRWFAGAIASVSLSSVSGRTGHAIVTLVPLALLAGALLAAAVIHIGRMQMSLPAAIRAAMRRGELYVEYQPIVDLADGRWIGVEALLRWRRRSGEVISPDVFVPAAERAGLGCRLTAHVIDLVGRDAGRLLRSAPDLSISLNVTADDLHDPATVSRIADLVRRVGARPGSFTIEATERVRLDAAVAAPIVRQVQDLGVAVVVDDFGSGYSSLSYLEAFDFDGIKIDRTFTESIGTDALTGGVVFQIIRLGLELQYTITAEGVETAEQAEVLRAHGVQRAQGWFFARPMSLELLLQHLSGHPSTGLRLPAPRRAT